MMFVAFPYVLMTSEQSEQVFDRDATSALNESLPLNLGGTQ